MYIPVRLPHNAFDLSRSAKEVPPPVARSSARKDVLGDESRVPLFPPGLRDVGGELERLLTRLSRNVGNGRRSRAELDFDRGQVERSSSVKSRAGLNGAETSFEKVELSFGGSTSVGKVGGNYVGGGLTATATSLRFIIDQDAVLNATSANAVAFHITDQTGATLYSYAGNLRAGEAVNIGGDIGLTLSFAEGTLVAGNSSAMRVFHNVPTEVDPLATFGNANANLRPRFEGGRQVTAGSFTVNGQLIELNDEDSVASVLQKIEALVPDLTASFEGDKVTLATRAHTRRSIELGNDTTGFLAATKLADGIVRQGFVRAEEELLWESQRFANVTDGSFRVGRKIITVDPLTDNLRSLLDRMNGAEPGVAAYYDKASGKVIVGGGDAEVSLGDDSSGFLAAIGLDGAGEAAAREGLLLDPGAAALLERTARGRQAELVDRTLSALAEGVDESNTLAEEARAAAYAKGAAARAKAAYGRERDKDGERPEPGLRLGVRFQQAFAAAGLGGGVAAGGGPARTVGATSGLPAPATQRAESADASSAG